MIANNDYSKYNLWSIGYGYSDSQMIHEKSFSLSAQGMEDFNKITAEGFYRWEFAPKQKLSLRLFAGYFMRNDTRNNLFDYGRNCFVSLQLNGKNFSGYDYGDGHHFSGTVSNNTASVYDYGTCCYFDYSV